MQNTIVVLEFFISVQEPLLNQIIEQLEKAIEMTEKEELSENDLEDLTGGFFFAIVASCLASAGLASFMRGWGRAHRKSRH